VGLRSTEDVVGGEKKSPSGASLSFGTENVGVKHSAAKSQRNSAGKGFSAALLMTKKNIRGAENKKVGKEFLSISKGKEINTMETAKRDTF